MIYTYQFSVYSIVIIEFVIKFDKKEVNSCITAQPSCFYHLICKLTIYLSKLWYVIAYSSRYFLFNQHLFNPFIVNKLIVVKIPQCNKFYKMKVKISFKLIIF